MREKEVWKKKYMPSPDEEESIVPGMSDMEKFQVRQEAKVRKQIENEKRKEEEILFDYTELPRKVPKKDRAMAKRYLHEFHELQEKYGGPERRKQSKYRNDITYNDRMKMRMFDAVVKKGDIDGFLLVGEEMLVDSGWLRYTKSKYPGRFKKLMRERKRRAKKAQ